MKGRELRRIRLQLGLTQEALAKRLGVAGNTVSRWEIGERPISPMVMTVVRLFAADLARTRRGKG